ncbi:thermonuclease family protein [Acidovorax soli]|uniref:Endonuclease YncB, thermonuclease family n=1 Tax=Acidovorax soli TaxID=592050 RepID=A0A1H4BVB3_9BURK|nr:thermonuclease family protein [Acidovorax soli]SEA52096.1 Endonuclease YncB, thermonuclease family [Acidovorax soli]
MATMAAVADTLDGKVVGVSDGDTVTLLTAEHRQIKIRIAGIDAPEKAQAFGQAAKKAMSACAFGKAASVEWKKLDRYGRTIGQLSVDGVDCGLRQVELGLAWHYKAYEREQAPTDRQAYAEAEKAAKEAGKGLWSDPKPQPPWEFRHSKASH